MITVTRAPGNGFQSDDVRDGFSSEDSNRDQGGGNDYGELKTRVRAWAGQTQHGQAHVERWLRVLHTFLGTANDATIMTSAEAREMADNFSAGRWNPVVAAIQCLEEQAGL